MSDRIGDSDAAEVSTGEAVRLVGYRPDRSERKDLITRYVSGSTWHWCLDTNLALPDAIALHRRIGDEVRVVVKNPANRPRRAEMVG